MSGKVPKVVQKITDFDGNPHITQICMSGKFLKRSKESLNCCQKVQTLQYSGQRQGNFWIVYQIIYRKQCFRHHFLLDQI